MLTQAAGPFAISIGTVCGDTRRTPRVSRMSSCPSIVRAPPVPVPITTASRSGSTPGAPASAHASRAATSAICSQRSMRRACTRSRTSPGSAFSRPAIRTGSSAAHSSSIARMPDRPASIAAQVDAASPPSGVVAPSPVTTTPSASSARPVPVAPPASVLTSVLVSVLIVVRTA